MLPQVTRAFANLSAFRALSRELPNRGDTRTVSGLPGSSASVLLACLAETHPNRAFLVAAESPAEAERWLADLTVLLGDRVRLYPQREALGEDEPHFEIAGERVETIDALLAGEVSVLVTTFRATAERTALASAVAASRVTVAVGDDLKPAEFVRRVEEMGYEVRPSVLDVAQVAVRGGIVDVYGFGMAAPARIEWWGDRVESIRAFDLDTQRSEGETKTVMVLPLRPSADAGASRERQTLLDLLPADTLLFAAEDGREGVDRMWEEATHHVDVARRRGEPVPSRESLIIAPETWGDAWASYARVKVRAHGGDVDFHLHAPEPVDRDIKRLRAMVAAGPTMILCDNQGQLERLDELLSESDRRGGSLPGDVTLAVGALHGGFVMQGLSVLTDHEIFRRARRIRRARRYRQAYHAAAGGALAPGDFVVHLEHGIGVYRGIETIETDSGIYEVAAIEYQGGDLLNVPLYRIDLIERYRSGADASDTMVPRLDRLGGTRWRKQRSRTQAAIQRMAGDLLDLYARRSVTVGYGFPPDTRWQAELESAFLYEDTPDQRTATEAVKRDMERAEPMDRLLVGDVGYGKTEIAVRAAFKAAVAGKQVAVLVPTTILAEQHARTFSDRLADFPVVVEVLSRFRTRAEQREILQRLKAGKIDIVIGTHRLLSKDAEFHDLGLVVVDEEQRFGVRHKERLKELRLEVDVLTLTATPIPRTLHFALSGLRDLSLIQTPPRDRSPVLTFVELWDDELLEEVLARELDRGGQVYFVHNRIETIETIAERVRGLAPRARVEVGHGQMPEKDLETVMRRFGLGQIDILVSTMIVESGLDVTNANTMIVHEAGNFGLAQLYQLRGRVGRGHRRAYCYLLVSDRVDPEAEQRLKLLEHHTELGAGYWLALRDLEIRGAGNLLGTEQSGHTNAVGFDLYMRWLAETVKVLRGEGLAVDTPPPEVLLDGAAHLPDAYVPDEDVKLDVYRRLARATELDDIEALRSELRDRFGRWPDPTDRLLTVFALRIAGAAVGVQTISVRGEEARIKFRQGTAPRMAGLHAALEEVQFAADIRQMVPLSMRLTRLGGLPLGRGLVRVLRALAEDGTVRTRSAPVGAERS